MSKILKATHGSEKTQLKLSDEIEISCYVLENGQRVLSQRGMIKALGLSGGSSKEGADRLASFAGQERFNDLISNDVRALITEPIKFEKSGSSAPIYGYEATILIDICDAVMQAKKEGRLQKQQNHVAENAEILIRAFAKTGIIALVDEATGYQYDRERFELQKILSTYIAEEILKWQLTFTDDFYKQVYRLWNLPFIPKYIKNKPSFIGNITRTYVYDQLPKGVVDVIKAKTGKTDKGNWKYKWHQSLTPEVGREHLKRQITEVTTLMSIADTKDQFIALFRKKYGKGDDGQMLLDFPIDDDPISPSTLSIFNTNLRRATNYRPNNEDAE